MIYMVGNCDKVEFFVVELIFFCVQKVNGPYVDYASQEHHSSCVCASSGWITSTEQQASI